MEPKDILIRMLKDGHLTEDEFKCIYDQLNDTIQWQHPIPDSNFPIVWHGITDPLTGEFIGPTYNT